jgi:lysozyme family protein
MIKDYPAILAFVLQDEGGWVNDPQDPGGATNAGITQAVYDRYRQGLGLPLQSVASISAAEESAIYGQQYWAPIQGDSLPAGVDYAVLDFAVNSGVGRAAKHLQTILGVAADGFIGPATLAAANARDPIDLLDAICDDREAYLEQLPTFPHFGKGWIARVGRVEARAKEMAA